MKTTLGVILISLPFIIVTILSIKYSGFWETVIVWALALIIMGYIISGRYLLFEM